MAAMAAEVQHLVDQKVPETTRLALQENSEVKAQISQLSEQTHVLMEENSALRDRKSRLSVDVDILEQMLSETSRKSCIRKKVRVTDIHLLIIWAHCGIGSSGCCSFRIDIYTSILYTSSSLYQVVEQLTEKCQQLKAELNDCKRELEQLQTKHTGVLAEMEALRSKFTPSLLSTYH